MTITHVCFSDLHFGAETSLLTNLSPNGTPDFQGASPVLSYLLLGLRALLHEQPKSQRPTLVLAGDVLELALARTHQAAMTFEKFLNLAFPGGDNDLFAREIIYVPGNHDHHLWERTRETHYLDYLRTIAPNSPLGPEWHITRLYRQGPKDFPEENLLTGLAQRNPTLRDIRVKTAYPNMGLISRDGRRSVVFTHGHFIEPLYTLMSDLKRFVFPESAPLNTLVQMEEENFAWIDFFWSTMGRSGDAGRDVQRVYEMAATEKGRNDISERLATGVVNRFLADNWIPDSVERMAFDKLFNFLLNRALTRERKHPAAPLSEGAEAGLRKYLDGPLRQQIERECRHSHLPELVSVVFGHTHKPFEQSFELPHYAYGVEVLNSGGWVVDTVERQPQHGGSMIVVDDNCRCAALRLYNETEDGHARLPVRSAAVGENELSTALQERIDATCDHWTAFAEVASKAVEVRARALAQRIGSA